MKESNGVGLKGFEKEQIILALLAHSSLISFRPRFVEAVQPILNQPDDLEKISKVSGIPQAQLEQKGRELLEFFRSDKPLDYAKLSGYAKPAVAFFSSPELMGLWGHFTMALSKLFRNDQLMNDIAGFCGYDSTGQVLEAIREFSSPEKFKVGEAANPKL